MCGLTGVAGNLAHNVEIPVFDELLHVTNLRGKHSTGVAGIKRDGSTDIIKCVGPALELMEHKGYDSVRSASKFMLMGHCRAATIGDKTKANAHPFDFDGLVGAHNGTLDYSCRRNLDGNDIFGTDSETMLNHMNNHGVSETVPLLEGAWAVTLFDKKTNTINMFRNDKRNLYYTYTDKGKVLWWNSEIGLLSTILHRNGVEFDKIFMVEADTWLQWKVPANNGVPFDKPTMRPLKGKQKEADSQHFFQGKTTGQVTVLGRTTSVPTHVSNNNSGGGSIDVGRRVFAQQANKVLELRQRRQRESAINEHNKRLESAKFRPPYLDQNGETINKGRFNYMTLGGCSYCESNINWGEAARFFPDDANSVPQVLCKTCLKDEDIVGAMKSSTL